MVKYVLLLYYMWTESISQIPRWSDCTCVFLKVLWR